MFAFAVVHSDWGAPDRTACNAAGRRSQTSSLVGLGYLNTVFADTRDHPLAKQCSNRGRRRAEADAMKNTETKTAVPSCR